MDFLRHLRAPLAGVDKLGQGAAIVGKPIVRNSGRIEIGRDFRFSGSPALSHLVTGSHGTLIVGDRVHIDHGAAIFAAKSVFIGDDVRIGAHNFIMDTDFHRSGAFDEESDVAPIVIGRGARIGTNVVLLRGAVIGERAEIASGSVVGNSEIAPGSRVGGVPARPLQSGDSSGSVPEIIASVLGLTLPPVGTEELQGLPGWESLAQLRLLLALEDSFGAVSSNDFLKARTVADVVALASGS